MYTDLHLNIFPAGTLMANCIIAGDKKTKEGIVIDPGGSPSKIIKYIKHSGLKIIYIVNTHSHFDHVEANEEIKAFTGADILIHEKEAAMLTNLTPMGRMFGMEVKNSPPADKTLQDKDKIAVGNLIFEVIHTPGHSPGGICLYEKNNSILISGDALFAQGIGRTDLPGGSYKNLIDSIKTKLFKLPKETKVYPGHGPETTIGNEIKYNPFLN